MLRFLVGLAVVACLAACLVLPISGCSSDNNDTAAGDDSKTQSTAKAADSESRSKIPSKELKRAENYMNDFIKRYDEGGMEP